MKMSQVETASRIVLKFVEAFNRHDVVEMIEWISDFCVFESFTPAPNGTKYHEKTNIRQYWEDFFRQYPEANLHVEEIIGFGVRCVARWGLTWVDSSREKKSLRGVDVYKVISQKITEMFSYTKK